MKTTICKQCGTLISNTEMIEGFCLSCIYFPMKIEPLSPTPNEYYERLNELHDAIQYRSSRMNNTMDTCKHCGKLNIAIHLVEGFCLPCIYSPEPVAPTDGTSNEHYARLRELNNKYIRSPVIPTTGIKHDTDKLRFDLLPVDSIEEVVKVLTKGAKKYAPDNWRLVEGRKDRYYAAALRHITAYRKGETTDTEFNTHILANAICCLIFLMQEDLENDAR